jgi:hypothetical protein
VVRVGVRGAVVNPTGSPCAYPHPVLCCAVLCCAVLCCAVLTSLLCFLAESVAVPAGASESLWASLDTVRAILDGTKSFELHLDFLFRHNKTDPLLLLALKTATDSAVASTDNRSSVLHNAAIVAHGFMSCGACHGAVVMQCWARGPFCR